MRPCGEPANEQDDKDDNKDGAESHGIALGVLVVFQGLVMVGVLA